MQNRSENEIVSRLLELENDGQAERRAELTGERYLSLLHDPDSGRGYVFRHGFDDTEGAEIPPDTEFFEYPNLEAAEQAYEQQLREFGAAGEIVEEDTSDDIGDFETSGAEVRDLYSASDEDEQVKDPVISEDEET